MANQKLVATHHVPFLSKSFPTKPKKLALFGKSSLSPFDCVFLESMILSEKTFKM